jgi:hypothetical protein
MVLLGRLVREGALRALLDGTVRAVELRCASLTPAQLEALAPVTGPATVLPEGHAFTCASVEAANQAAARLLAAGGRLLSVQPHRESLEETFVRLASAAGTGREGPLP